MQIDLKKEAPKIIYAVLNLLGGGLLAFNLLAFKSSERFGSIWFQDTNQTWATVGVILLMLAYFQKNWGKLLSAK